MDGSRPARLYRGSNRRIRRIRPGMNLEVWLLVGWTLFLLSIVLPWMAARE
jgi:hypothetical protein